MTANKDIDFLEKKLDSNRRMFENYFSDTPNNQQRTFDLVVFLTQNQLGSYELLLEILKELKSLNHQNE